MKPDGFHAAALEALLFASPEPLSFAALARVLDIPEAEVRSVSERLEATLNERGSGLTLRRVAGGLALSTRPEFHDYVSCLQPGRRRTLSRAALETLAVIAYNQPIARASIDAIRGVDSSAALEGLLERGLVEEAGRAKRPGRPFLYRITKKCLRDLGIDSAGDLPPLPGVPG